MGEVGEIGLFQSGPPSGGVVGALEVLDRLSARHEKGTLGT